MSLFMNLLFIITFTFAKINGNIFLWCNTHIDVPTLKYFDDDSLIALRDKLNKTQLIVFHGNIKKFNSISSLFHDKYTAYITNGDLNVKDSIELDDNGNVEEMILNKTNHLDDNYIGVIIDNVKRKRREIKEIEDDERGNYSSNVLQPVAYMSEEKQAIIYSSKYLLLTVNATKYYLGPAKLTTLDTRNNYTRLSARIVLDDKDKITLRFKFTWLRGYWSFSLIELEYTDLRKYNLTLDKELIAPRNFSYHCSGHTTFADVDNGLELTLYDLQAQPDADDGVFNDAYDCIPFTTVPIWSGIFVVTFLTIVLGIGLNALGNIKITHGCENIKLKELCIAVGNE